MQQKPRLLPSGINDFERIRRDNLYYVDKTKYIATLEGGDSYVFFGRPRRFGKSLFVRFRNPIEGERNIQGYYMAYLSLCPYYVLCPEVEMNHGYCVIFLMPDRRFKDVKHSYIVELKHVKTTDKPEETEKKFAEATAQLKVYASDEKVKNMTAGTTLHKIVMVFRGLELEKMEEV